MQPHVVLQRANLTMLRRQAPIVTVVCGFVDPMTHAFSYACAGHPPSVVVRRDGSVELLPYGGVPLGIDDAAKYETRHVHDLADALFALYTDGRHGVPGTKVRK